MSSHRMQRHLKNNYYKHHHHCRQQQQQQQQQQRTRLGQQNGYNSLYNGPVKGNFQLTLAVVSVTLIPTEEGG